MLTLATRNLWEEVRFGVAATITFVLLTFSAHATNYYVNDNSTSGDLYTTAVGNDANAGTAAAPFATLSFSLSVGLASGDTIFIDAGTYTDFNLTLSTAGVTIMGAGNAVTIFDNGMTGTGRRFLTVGANNCVVRDLGVTGYTTTTPGEGKAITISSVTNVELNQVSMYNHGTSGGEPPLYVSGGGASHLVTVRNCTIQNNNAGASNFGGGVTIDGSSNNLEVDLINCFIANNTKASSFGGGVRIEGAPTVDIDFCTIQNNSAQTGGGIYIGGNALVTMTNSCASFNTSTANTGSDGGGGIAIINGSVTLNNMMLEGNTASQYGGGIFVRGNFGNIVFGVENSMFEGNTGERGSGLHISSGVAATVNNCLFYDNHATGTGFVDGGTINVRSTSSPTDNSLEIYNSTLTENTAADEGGLVNENTSGINAYNCIFWNNQGADVFDGGSGNVNVSYSIIDATGGSSYTDLGNNSGADPLFLDAANDDFRIDNTSPAFDAGTTNGGLAPTADMVGTARTATPDMGAFEEGASQVTIYNACLIDPCIPVLSATAITDVPCFEGSNGSIDATITNGGCGGDTYEWTNSSGTTVGTTEDLSNVPAGIYYLTINGTYVYGPFVITQPAPVVVSFTGLADTVCANVPAMTLTGNQAPSGVFSGTGVTDNANGTGSFDPNGLSTGDYDITYSYTYNTVCVEDTVLSIHVYPIPVVEAGGSNAVCSGDSMQLGGSPAAMNGTAPYNYAWLPASGLSDASVANPMAAPTANTTYTLTVTDDNNCAVSDNVTVTANANPVASAGSSTAICDGATTTLGGSPTGNGGTGTLIYSWTPATGLSDPSTANPTVTPSATGTYQVLVTDANACVDSASVTITVNPTPVADAGTASVTICENESIQLGGAPTGSGGTGTLTYSWSPATGLDDPTLANPTSSVNTTTTYTVTVTDANSCSSTSSVTVNVNPTPTADAGAATAVICNGSSVVLGGAPTGSGGTGSLGYSWTPITDLSNPLDANPTASPTSTTTYTVTVSDGNGCSAVDSVAVTVNPLPVIDINGLSIQDANCGGSNGSITGITATGAPTLTYSWDNGSAVVGTSLDLLNQPSGIYVLTVTDGNGCVATAGPFGINDIGGPVLDIVSAVVADDTCGQGIGSISGVTVSGGAGTPAFSWTDGNGQVMGTSLNLSNLFAGAYTLLVTDTAGCSSATGPFTVNDVAGPSIDLTNLLVAEDTCGQSIGSITGVLVNGGTGSLSYNWLDSANNSVGSGTQLSSIADGSYTLVVTDAAGCADTAGAFVVNTITGPGVFDLNAVVTDAACGQANGSITGLSISGGTPSYTYAWSTNGNVVGTNLDLTNVGAGTYELTVTDAAGCIAVSLPFTISDLGGPTLDLANALLTDATCGDANGSIAGITVVGGNGAMTVEWFLNGTLIDSTLDIANLSAGNYVLVVTDTNGCSSTSGPYTLNDLAGPSIDASTLGVADAACGQSDGSITGIAASGNGTLDYSWSDGSNVVGTALDLNGMPAGSYTLTVTDTNGCIATAGPFQLTDQAGPSIDLSNLSVSPENCGAGDGSISGVLVTSGTSPYTFEWSQNGTIISTSTTTLDLTGLAVGTYDLSVTDANGCQVADQVTVGGSNNVSAIISANPISGFAPLDVDFENVGTTSGTAAWDFGDSIGFANGHLTSYTYTEIGTYEVILTVVSPEGCVAYDTITINVEGESDIEVPNVFTPNGDGVNDIFTVNTTNITQFNAFIYNRWGQLMYQWSTVNGGWDGRTTAGEMASEGTYFIIIDAEGSDGVEYDITGDITLIY